MSIASQIARLQQAKADIKTAIENKGVTVSSNTKLDDYADLIDSIETGGGGSMPTIVNPFNGGYFGTEYNYGTITHQYEVSEGTIDKCYLAVMNSGSGGLYGSTSELYVKSVDTGGWSTPVCIITIDDSGLLSCVYNRSQSDVEEYPWMNNCNVYVLIELNNGTQLIDIFRAYTYFTCFVKGTKITLANGESINVEDVDYNHSLLVWDFDNGQKSSAYPLWVSKSLIADHYKLITLDDGKQMKLVGTGENCHRLFCIEDGQFVYANKMVGKTTIYQDGTHHKVVNCEIVSEKVEYYNIITNYHINLYADDVLTSCRYNNIYPIEDMRYIKDGRPIRKQCEYNVAEKYYTGLRLGEQKIDVNSTLKYINNLISLDVQTASS